jgi:hypothetical protein
LPSGETEGSLTHPEAEETPLTITPEQDSAFRAIADLNAVPLESFATVRSFEAAGDLFGFLLSYPLNSQQWAFRGHADVGWKLETSIERLREKYSSSFRMEAEEYVRKAFKRRAHHYLEYLPGERQELEWLALMRHHSAPTRLLDWTKSPYVAMFFALAEAGQDQTSAIWAIDINAVKNEAVQLLVENGVIDDPAEPDFSFSEPDVFDRVFLQNTNPAIVAPVQPLKMNERATSQQGLFLCPNALMWGFEFGLKQVLKSDRDRVGAWCREKKLEDEPSKPERLFKLKIAPQARSEVLRQLHRMNINYATLFPGLDGFAQSLRTNVTISGFDQLSFGGVGIFDALV